ncbi:hypothetical protein [Aureispira sp. CCB-QB1]|uniref:hypothetical protein n=1 Tax=Aureispira sp. CCB-QB1 TaxID=1313421 RepID=UPI000695A52A|nr:hypothetical protein [Aureispira sp. CCB-QB1]
MWRQTTFEEIQQLILDQMPEIRAIDLFNNQLDDYRGEDNNAAALPKPLVLIEFVGGDWQHDQNIRISEEYFFRLHLVLSDYQKTHSGSTTQSQALANLDKVSILANVLDLKTLTYAHNFEFVREEIDASRTNLINHTLDFVARVVDCSLEEARALDQVQITTANSNVYRNNDTQIQDLSDNNQKPDTGGTFKIPS